MLIAEQLKELCRQFLEGEISELEFRNNTVLKICDEKFDGPTMKWFAEQLLIAR